MKTPCPNKEKMAPYDCDHKEQCWEPCGELGNDERFVAVAWLSEGELEQIKRSVRSSVDQ